MLVVINFTLQDDQHHDQANQHLHVLHRPDLPYNQSHRQAFRRVSFALYSGYQLFPYMPFRHPDSSNSFN